MTICVVRQLMPLPERRKIGTSFQRQLSIIKRSAAIMEVEIEEMCINLLALQQPMARDLRMLTSALKIASDLERVGDHATNIAEWVTYSITGKHVWE